jgi:hypothetical protein
MVIYLPLLGSQVFKSVQRVVKFPIQRGIPGLTFHRCDCIQFKGASGGRRPMPNLLAAAMQVIINSRPPLSKTLQLQGKITCLNDEK